MAIWPNVPGYTLVRRIARGATGVIYEAQAPGGFSKAIKIVPVDHSNPLSKRELDGVGLVRSIRHPYLIAIDRVDVADDQVTIVMELADGSLYDEFKAARAAGLHGIPRRRLLAWMSEAAEVLDFLNFRHQVRHLDVKPENLFLVGGHLKVGDFGLAREADRPHISATSNAATPKYAPPELFEGQTFASSDQYSLAVVFCAMISGRSPYDGVTHSELYGRQVNNGPNLSGVPELDRDALRKSLSPVPAQRFESCSALVDALWKNALTCPNDEAVYPGPGGEMRSLEHDARPASHPSRPIVLDPKPPSEPTVLPTLATVFVPGRSPSRSYTQHWVIQSTLSEAVMGFRAATEARGAQLLEPTPFTLVLYLQGGPRGWRPLLGVRDPFLLVVRLLPRNEKQGGVHVVTTLEHHGAELPPAVFELHSKALFDELLRDVPMRRATPVPLRNESRSTYNGRIELVPKIGGLRNMTLNCMGIDASPSGLGLFSLAPIEPGAARIRLETGAQLAARVVRCRSRSDLNGYELGLTIIDGQLPESILFDS